MTKLYTMINADEAAVGDFGYFANNIEDLQYSVNKCQCGRRVAYDRLRAVMAPKYTKRFDCESGSFALFYTLADHYAGEIYR